MVQEPISPEVALKLEKESLKDRIQGAVVFHQGSSVPYHLQTVVIQGKTDPIWRNAKRVPVDQLDPSQLKGKEIYLGCRHKEEGHSGERTFGKCTEFSLKPAATA